MTNCLTARSLTLDKKTLEYEKQKIRIFEGNLAKSLGEFEDDTAKLLKE